MLTWTLRTRFLPDTGNQLIFTFSPLSIRLLRLAKAQFSPLGEEAVSLAKELETDVAIIDVAMPRLNGIEAARQISTVSPDTAVLMISAYSYESYFMASLRAGVAGYMALICPHLTSGNFLRILKSAASCSKCNRRA